MFVITDIRFLDNHTFTHTDRAGRVTVRGKWITREDGLLFNIRGRGLKFIKGEFIMEDNELTFRTRGYKFPVIQQY